MARPTETLQHRRFTVEEYRRMGDAGILAPGERVELIRGVIREMTPKRRPHVVAATKVLKVFFKTLEGRASVYLEAPLELQALDSEPEPDVIVLQSRRRVVRNPRNETLRRRAATVADIMH
jgi:Uma2 family endonuclease